MSIGQRTLIGDLHEHIGECKIVRGWISVRRDQGKLVFFDVRDMSGTVQAVALPQYEDVMMIAKETKPEYVVEVQANVNKRPEKNINAEVQNGDIELEIKAMRILNAAKELPFELGIDVNLDTYLDYLPFTLRDIKIKQIFKLQETVLESFRATLKKENFTEFQAPAIVGGDAEGGAAAFPVDYLRGAQAFLATSPQFYKQIMVGVFESVFTTPKVFRGEAHSTPRHLNEYSSMDFEMGFIEDHRDVMATLERAIRTILKNVSEKHAETFKLFGSEFPLMPEKIPVLKLREAQELLEKEFGAKCAGEPDLEPEHERQLCEWAKREKQSDFVFVTHYPISKRPFYTYEDENEPGFTKSFDLLFRGLEITTGSQRIHNHDTLVEKIKAKKLDPERFSYYLQAFKYGMPPHGGCATGLERITARLLNIPNIKQATLFPRDLNRIDKLLSTDEK